jgi:rare lipoprotein A (peptidoglycan hydrolase)
MKRNGLLRCAKEPGRGRIFGILLPDLRMVLPLLGLVVLSGLTCNASEMASWYGEQHRGRLMANGQPFDPDKLTAASWFFELGAKVVVEHGGRRVVVVVTDRGPNRRLVREGRTVDLSQAAFAKLADPKVGLIPVKTRKLTEAGTNDP